MRERTTVEVRCMVDKLMMGLGEEVAAGWRQDLEDRRWCLEAIDLF